MNHFQGILDDLREFEASPESRGFDLRLDLADIILRHLDGKRWTQKRLAEAAGMKPSFLTRVIHASNNCTFDVAGRILFALGVQAKLIETQQDDAEAYLPISAETTDTSTLQIQDIYGQEEEASIRSESTEPTEIAGAATRA